MSGPGRLQRALDLHRSGAVEAAIPLYRGVLLRDPSNPDALHYLGLGLHQLGNSDEAERLVSRAVVFRPQWGEAFNTLAAARAARGDLDGAVAAYHEALRLMRDPAEVRYNLGALLLRCGRASEALPHLVQAVAAMPQMTSLRKALGYAFKALGRPAAAVEHFAAAARSNPRSGDALNDLGGAFLDLGRVADAEACFRSAVALDQGFPEAHANLGLALSKSGRSADAVHALTRALALRPDFLQAQLDLASALRAEGEVDAAQAWAERAVQLAPLNADAYAELASCLQVQARHDAANAHFRRALELRPDSTEAFDSLLFNLHFTPGLPGAEIFREYQRFDQRFGRHEQSAPAGGERDLDPARRLRVGYVSHDFRTHATNYFFEPVLEHHDRAGFEILCFDTNPVSDTVTARLGAHAHEWHQVAGLSDDELAALIRSRGVDILVDLKGHTDGNRLLVFARKPAPIQATWLGYPNTTGLRAVDYWITDTHIASPEMHDQQHSEALVRLPNFYLCFRPRADAPEPGPPPAMRNGYVTFGSFNQFAKLNDGVLDAWAELLRGLPASRICIAAVPKGSTWERVWSRFDGRGVERTRVLLHPRLPEPAFLQLHQEVDVCLDAFPCAGTTTTLQDLWMGCPVVSLAGATHASRVGAGILSNLGLHELIATTPEQYLAAARHLACDIDRLAVLRATLRARLSRSALTDAPRFTRDLETAYRGMWERWVSGGMSPTGNQSAPARGAPDSERR